MGQYGAGPVTIRRADGTTETRPPLDLHELAAITKVGWRKHIFGTDDLPDHDPHTGVAVAPSCAADDCDRTVPWSAANRRYCSEPCRLRRQALRDKARRRDR